MKTNVLRYRANKERCTRRKKDGHDVCGTHLKEHLMAK